ncbi:MAG: hypothetical protein DI556_15930 [Rhodovulum sulfidophilum]|uniref:Uncharacterized protein n=1 Tax=Rhodovulum sulfidophilum TaxID=35806 RepID=A0A2W5Q9B1_RHOSU|nr:MAG: hypothetical protein DI556_15930 [Rhodovulum sulfidophilum]
MLDTAQSPPRDAQPRSGRGGRARPISRDRIETGWFGRPVEAGLRAGLFRLGARALAAIERAFIKPTHRRGGDDR